MRRVLTLTALILSLAGIAAQVAAAGYQELLRDACRDEKVDGTYSQKDYREAIANIPADADQYTNCRDVLRAAQLAAARTQSGGGSTGSGGSGGSGGSSGSGAAAAPTAFGTDPLDGASPQERAAVAKAAGGGDAPVTVDGAVIEPSTFGAGRSVAGAVTDLPTPLLVVLALVALGALGALLLVLLQRVRDRRNA
jgi:hypothetical protein